MKTEECKISLLAPARDLEVGKAAIQAGADAVYIGAPEFGARQAAGNSLEDIATLVEYAHRFGVQVLVTLSPALNSILWLGFWTKGTLKSTSIACASSIRPGATG